MKLFFLFLMNVVNTYLYKGPSFSGYYGSCICSYLCNQCLSPLILWVRISIRARCATLCDKVCQWFATGQWFSPGPSGSSTDKTDRHDIAEMVLNMVLNTIKLNQPISKRDICQFKDYFLIFRPWPFSYASLKGNRIFIQNSNKDVFLRPWFKALIFGLSFSKRYTIRKGKAPFAEKIRVKSQST